MYDKKIANFRRIYQKKRKFRGFIPQKLLMNPACERVKRKVLSQVVGRNVMTVVRGGFRNQFH